MSLTKQGANDIREKNRNQGSPPGLPDLWYLQEYRKFSSRSISQQKPVGVTEPHRCNIREWYLVWHTIYLSMWATGLGIYQRVSFFGSIFSVTGMI